MFSASAGAAELAPASSRPGIARSSASRHVPGTLTEAIWASTWIGSGGGVELVVVGSSPLPAASTPRTPAIGIRASASQRSEIRARAAAGGGGGGDDGSPRAPGADRRRWRRRAATASPCPGRRRPAAPSTLPGLRRSGSGSGSGLRARARAIVRRVGAGAIVVGPRLRHDRLGRRRPLDDLGVAVRGRVGRRRLLLGHLERQGRPAHRVGRGRAGLRHAAGRRDLERLLELRHQREHRVLPLGGVLGQRPQQRLIDLVGQTFDERGRDGRRLIEVGEHHRGLALAAERDRSRQALEGDRAERVEVAALAVGVSPSICSGAA